MPPIQCRAQSLDRSSRTARSLSPTPLPAPERWLKDHGNVLYGYAYMRLHDADSAEDVLQETLLSAWRARHSFAGRSSERTWLIGILKHRLADHWRQLCRQPSISTAFDERSASDDGATETCSVLAASASWPEPEAALEQQQLWQALVDCIALLPKAQARAFALCELEGLSSEDACELLGIAPPNLWVTLHRARTKLRQSLRDRA